MNNTLFEKGLVRQFRIEMDWVEIADDFGKTLYILR
jgi:hypothetical protein